MDVFTAKIKIGYEATTVSCVRLGIIQNHGQESHESKPNLRKFLPCLRQLLFECQVTNQNVTCKAYCDSGGVTHLEYSGWDSNRGLRFMSPQAISKKRIHKHCCLKNSSFAAEVIPLHALQLLVAFKLPRATPITPNLCHTFDDTQPLRSSAGLKTSCSKREGF